MRHILLTKEIKRLGIEPTDEWWYYNGLSKVFPYTHDGLIAADHQYMERQCIREALIARAWGLT